jgi:hypothetical protein
LPIRSEITQVLTNYNIAKITSAKYNITLISDLRIPMFLEQDDLKFLIWKFRNTSNSEYFNLYLTNFGGEGFEIQINQNLSHGSSSVPLKTMLEYFENLN